jgi:hypothetical protein
VGRLARRLGTRRITALMAGAGVVLVAVTTVLVAGPDAGSTSTDDSRMVQRLREIERTRLHALVEADMQVAGPLHAEDFQVVSPPGFLLTREEYLGSVASGELDYTAFDPVSAIEVRLHGNSAVLWYRSHIDVVAAGQGRFAHETWHTYLYEKRQGRWQAVWEQATAVGGFPPPEAP